MKVRYRERTPTLKLNAIGFFNKCICSNFLNSLRLEPITCMCSDPAPGQGGRGVVRIYIPTLPPRKFQ